MSALLSLLLFTSCGMFDDDDATCQTDSDAKGYLSVRLQISTGTDTRADENPYGGEDGNGREAGINNENDINNVTLLFYKGDGINSTDASSVTIEEAMYFSSLTYVENSTYTYTSATIECPTSFLESAYHVIVIANAGDLTTLKGHTLADVRDYEMKNLWTSADNISDYNNFVMSSESDATLDIKNNPSGTGTESNPYVLTASIERLAARIDIVPGDENTYKYNSTDNTYTYPVYNSESSTTEESDIIGYYVLKYVMPINCYNDYTYLIKRVGTSATSVTDNVTYLGAETATSNVATNYVYSPYFLEKAGDTYATTLQPLYKNYGTAYTDFSSYPVAEAKQYATDGDSYFIVGYTMENTLPNANKSYITGLLFNGTYYTKSEWNSGSPAEGSGTSKTYTYYIRHSDPTGTGTTEDPMYYGIVRNNIYRIKIEKILGEGDSGMQLTINVRKWATYTHSEVIM
ncbi:MAG: fimbria major subunit, partial [Prevotellaceae bacterium]|nr:fimbria major subunit [Prevotellaceae bacterium]